jgi:DNA-binding GntR family transcriptional regulator
MKTVRRITAREKVYTMLRNLIIEGKLRPGEFLNEIELSKNMGVSRTPLREALGKLEHDNFITVFPGKGSFVKQITARDINNLYTLREILECLSVKLAGENLLRSTTTAIIKLQEYISKFEENIKSDAIDPKKQFILNKEFHTFIAECSMNPYLIQMLNILDGMDSLIRVSVSPYRNSTKELAEEHFAIAKALLEQKIDRAVELMQQHIKASKEDAMRISTVNTKIDDHNYI